MSEKEKESLVESEEEAAPIPPIDEILDEEAPTSDEGNGDGNGGQEAACDESGAEKTES